MQYIEEAIDGEVHVGSLRHSSIQTNIGYLLKANKAFKIHVLTELSLDISKFDLGEYDLKAKNELKPDVSGYFFLPDVPKKRDLVCVTQMPDLAIEILSPGQAFDYLQRKIQALFAIGVQSCWLIIPSEEMVIVYSTPESKRVFTMENEEVRDEKLKVYIPIKEIFEL